MAAYVSCMMRVTMRPVNIVEIALTMETLHSSAIVMEDGLAVSKKLFLSHSMLNCH